MTDSTAIRPDPWAKVWRTLASGRLLLAWVIVLTLVCLIAIWFPQVPRSAYLQENGLESWLTAIRPQLGRSADTLMALGLLTISRSAWLRVILAGTALTLFLRAFDAIQWLASSSLFPRPDFSLQIETASEAQAALEVVRSQLPHGFRVRVAGSEQRLTAHRPMAFIGPLGTALGGLLLIAGWLWIQRAGWEVSDIRVTEGVPGTIEPSGQIMTLDALHLDWGDGDSPTAAEARLRVGDDPAAAGTVSLDESWRWQKVSYSLDAVGPALRVSGTGPEGEVLMLQTAAHRPPAPDLTFMLLSGEPRSFAAPDQGVVVQAEAAPTGGRFSVRLRIYQGQAGELVEDRPISERRTIELEGSRLIFEVIPFAQISASSAPGQSLLLFGAGVVLAGLLSTMLFRPLLTEVVATDRGEGTELTLAVGRSKDAAWLKALAGRLEFAHTGDNDGD